MGNSIGAEEGGSSRQSFIENGSGAAPKFRVYIHRRNRVIHAWLRILPDQIQLEPESKGKQKGETVSWPLDLIRRYGYTSAGVFFFESGRRCSTGEGLHCFQTQYADAVFNLVQQRVQEHANSGKETRRGSSSRNERARSSQPDFNMEIDRGKINPLQRFGSEGTCVSPDRMLPRSGSSWSPASLSSRKFRQNALPPAPRPRSATYEGGISSLPPYKISKGGGDQLGSKIVGNIISESTNPCRDDLDLANAMTLPRHTFPEPIPPTYVNITPTSDGNGVAFKFHRARTNSASSVNSVPTSPVAPSPTIVPIKWDSGSCSASLLCHLPLPETGSKLSYVNLNPTKEHREAPLCRFVPGMNYADMSIEQPGPSRSISTENPPNYSLIDVDKTRALQAAALERRAQRRHQTID